MKILNRLSSSLGSTSLSPIARPRLRLISNRALSLASVLTCNRMPSEEEETSNLDMIVELDEACSSSTIEAD